MFGLVAVVSVDAEAQPARTSAAVRADPAAHASRARPDRVPVGRASLSRAPRFSCATDREDIGPRQAVVRAPETLAGPNPRRLSGMAATHPADEIPELSSKLDTIEAVVDPEAMRTEAADLREQSADPGLWEDQTRAQQVTRRLSYLEGELGRMESLRQRLADTQVMFELAEEDARAGRQGRGRSPTSRRCGRTSTPSRSARC